MASVCFIIYIIIVITKFRRGLVSEKDATSLVRPDSRGPAVVVLTGSRCIVIEFLELN